MIIIFSILFPGYYCNATYEPVSWYGSYECPEGYYCLNNTEYDTQYPCPVGTFLNRTKGSSPDDCESCLGRYACDTEGLIYPSRLCSSGFFCRSGANTTTPRMGLHANECPSGHYCIEG